MFFDLYFLSSVRVALLAIIAKKTPIAL